MLSVEKYNEVLDDGLILDHYYLLCNIKNGNLIVANKRIQGFINLLTKKEYIKDDVLTQKALDLIESCGYTLTEEEEEKESNTTINLNEWVAALHKECEDKLVALVGKKQVRGKVKGVGYPFLPNARDLATKILKVITIYKLRDLALVKATILRHIDTCHATSNWFPIIKYYIMKEGDSQLVTDMGSLEDDDKKDDEQFESFKREELF